MSRSELTWIGAALAAQLGVLLWGKRRGLPGWAFDWSSAVAALGWAGAVTNLNVDENRLVLVAWLPVAVGLLVALRPSRLDRVPRRGMHMTVALWSGVGNSLLVLCVLADNRGLAVPVAVLSAVPLAAYQFATQKIPLSGFGE